MRIRKPNLNYDYKLLADLSSCIIEDISSHTEPGESVDPVLYAFQHYPVVEIILKPIQKDHEALALLQEDESDPENSGKDKQYIITLDAPVNQAISYLYDFKSERIIGIPQHLTAFQRIALSHEIGHLFVIENIQRVREVFKKHNRELTIVHEEILCDLYASWLLMPFPKVITHFKEVQKRYDHPFETIFALQRIFQVPIRHLLLQLIRVGVFKDKPWFIGIFRYGCSQYSDSEKKWRLAPRYVSVPQGFSSAKKIPIITPDYSLKLFTDHGLFHTGLDTLQLAKPTWARITNFNKLSKLYRSSLQSEEELPWDNLNKITLDRRSISRNAIHLNTNRNRFEIQQILQQVFSLNSPDDFNPRDVNKLFRIQASEIKLLGYNSPPKKYLLFAAKLSITKRY
ncbi:MAG: ImmA/IrrE family metallo-endopeptidase [Candidatus Cloacimonetes bacterium]|nr:ImmA/IrrE family metallo-endopeptidase [Candidatus Cloacimonadota bacterium]